MSPVRRHLEDGEIENLLTAGTSVDSFMRRFETFPSLTLQRCLMFVPELLPKCIFWFDWLKSGRVFLIPMTNKLKSKRKFIVSILMLLCESRPIIDEFEYLLDSCSLVAQSPYENLVLCRHFPFFSRMLKILQLRERVELEKNWIVYVRFGQIEQVSG